MSQKICKRCIMDISASGIVFNKHGYCNYCEEFQSRIASIGPKKDLKKLIEDVKSKKNKNGYDCIVGLSGGIDSSYVLYKAVELGLNPLAVHLDNGWNSELAVDNINKLITKLGVDLHTHVIDWEENKDLQNSMIKANVIDIEMLLDNAILALIFEMARKEKLPLILSGLNFSTEGMLMPKNWFWLKYDKRNIKDIQRKYGKIKIKTHKLISVIGFIVNRYFRNIQIVPFLDYLDYNKEVALKTLEKEIGFRRYGNKHYESIFTRFYQGFILPEKFGVDKRKLHLSTLIMTEQITREEGLKEIRKSPYASENDFKNDYSFVLKKLDISNEQFLDYMKEPETPHSFYKSEKFLWEFLNNIRKKLKFL